MATKKEILDNIVRGLSVLSPFVGAFVVYQNSALSHKIAFVDSRIDAKLDTKLNDLDTKFKSHFDKLDIQFNAHLDKLDSNVAGALSVRVDSHA